MNKPTIRPQSLHEFIGKKELVTNLEIFIESAKQRQQPLDHILFYGF